MSDAIVTMLTVKQIYTAVYCFVLQCVVLWSRKLVVMINDVMLASLSIYNKTRHPGVVGLLLFCGFLYPAVHLDSLHVQYHLDILISPVLGDIDVGNYGDCSLIRLLDFNIRMVVCMGKVSLIMGFVTNKHRTHQSALD